MSERSDAQLLRDYAEHGDEAAFRDLVARYTNLVFSAALRQVRAPDAAADIAQGVFVDLARKANGLSERLGAEGSLAGWLHRGTRYAALNHLRAAQRRLLNERRAMEQLLTNTDTPPDWEQIHPLLDAALDGLDDQDREAILLRYLQQHDFRSVGLALGVSDDAAQKRVSRALDQLRGHFSRRGMAIGAGVLAGLLSANAVQAAPPGLVAASTAAAMAGSGTGAAATATTASKVLGIALLRKALVASALAALAGISLYEAQEARQLRREVQALRERQTAAVIPLPLDSGSAPTTPADGTSAVRDFVTRDRTITNLELPAGLPRAQASAAAPALEELFDQNRQAIAQLNARQSEFLVPVARGGISQGDASEISARTENGHTLITYRGKEFALGKTPGIVSTRAKTIQGHDYAAAFVGDKVVWENVPGAAQRVK